MRIEKENLADKIRIFDLEQNEIKHWEHSAAEEVQAIREKRGQELAEEMNHKAQAARYGGVYAGRIVLVTRDITFQETSTGLISHQTKQLNERPKLNKDIWIGYYRDKGYIREAREQDKSQTLGLGL